MAKEDSEKEFRLFMQGILNLVLQKDYIQFH